MTHLAVMCGAVPPPMLVVRRGPGIHTSLKFCFEIPGLRKPSAENGPNCLRGRNFRSVITSSYRDVHQADGDTDVCRSGLGLGCLPIWQYCCDEERIIVTEGLVSLCRAFDVGELNNSTDQPCSRPLLISIRLPLPNYDCSTLIHLSAYLLKF